MQHVHCVGAGRSVGCHAPVQSLHATSSTANQIYEPGFLVILQDFEKHRLDETNLGYQLLQRAGWKEGEGLGKDGEGTAAPGAPHTAR